MSSYFIISRVKYYGLFSSFSGLVVTRVTQLRTPCGYIALTAAPDQAKSTSPIGHRANRRHSRMP